MKNCSARWLLLPTVLVLALVAAEFGYRAALFSPGDRLRSLREPGLYADPFSEDLFWKLAVAWSGEYRPPKRPHPTLGWAEDVSLDTLRHREARNLDGRRPVLLYGDSFAACFGEVACFEDILNSDSEFASGHYLLNYGVGGYGLDQTYLLFQDSIDYFERPFVIFSLFTYDIDRCLLSFRIGQKPRFSLAGGSLELEATPILASADDYLDAHPPLVVSYLYRRALFGGLLPTRVSAVLRRDENSRRRKIAISEAILSTTLAELESRSLDFTFLVFHGDRPSDNPLFGGTDWREVFLRGWLEKNLVPHIWSKEIVARALGPGEEPDVGRYLDPETLHPTEYFNRLVAGEIRRTVLIGRQALQAR